MSTHKTQIESSVAEEFIQEHLDLPAIKLEQIADGETSQAFYFESPEGPRVLRVNSLGSSGFKKDKMAHEQFNSQLVPVPEVIDIGEIKPGIFFAISKRAQGKTFDKFNTQEVKSLLPKIFSTLDAIHNLAPIGTGYGDWDLSGDGNSSSWREVIEQKIE